MPTKTWVVGEEVLAADFNTYVQKQIVATFANAAARDAALAAPTAGMLAYLTSTGQLQLWVGTVWVNMPGAGVAAVAITTTANSGGVANTPVVVPQLSGTVVLPTARRLKITLQMVIAQQGAASLLRPQVLMDGAGIASAFQNIAVNGFEIVHLVAVVNASGGNRTFTTYLSTDAGSANINASPSMPSTLLIEDLG